MIWRTPYSTSIVQGIETGGELTGTSVHGAPFQFADFSLLFAAFEAQHLLKLMVQVKLLERDLPSLDDWAIICIKLLPAEIDQVRVVLPQSMHDRTYFISNSVPEELDLGQPFAWATKMGLAMVGPLTEDAWEQLSGALKDR